VIIALPYQTLTEYFRDFMLGRLEKICSGPCPVCDGPVLYLYLRLRKVMDLPIFHGKCDGKCDCGISFLPLFVAPHKWYGYFRIEEALTFVAEEQYSSLSAVLTAWETAREIRLADGLAAFPSQRTVLRWWKRLEGRSSLIGAKIAIPAADSMNFPLDWPGRRESCGPDGLPGVVEVPVPASSAGKEPSLTKRRPVRPASIGDCLLSGLADLGSSLRPGFTSFLSQRPSAALSIPLFVLGLWFLEGRLHVPCLVPIGKVGNLTASCFPELPQTPVLTRPYLPATPPP